MAKKSLSLVLSSVFGLTTVVTIISSQPAEAVVECVPGSVARNAQGRITQCQLAKSWRFAQRVFPQNKQPTEEFDCQGQQPISFHPTGAVAFCTLDRPISIVQSGIRDQCPVGMRVFFTEQGVLQFPKWCGK